MYSRSQSSIRYTVYKYFSHSVDWLFPSMIVSLETKSFLLWWDPVHLFILELLVHFKKPASNPKSWRFITICSSIHCFWRTFLGFTGWWTLFNNVSWLLTDISLRGYSCVCFPSYGACHSLSQRFWKWCHSISWLWFRERPGSIVELVLTSPTISQIAQGL